MRTYDINKTKTSVTLFCRLVKFGLPCTAKAMSANNRNAQILKIVLSNKFTTKNGAPVDFPRLFVCDDDKQLHFHKCTTPNDVDLGDLETIRTIQRLMTFVRQTLQCSKKDCAKPSKPSSVKYDLARIKSLEYHDGFVYISFH